MNKTNTTVVESLYKHDLAACEVYKEVITHVKDPAVKRTLKGFLGDHEAHAKDWKAMLRSENGVELSDRRDLKGILLGGYATARSITGQEGALNALDTAEKVVLKQYKDASSGSGLNQEVKACVEDHFEDDMKHSQYIKKLLK